MFLKEHSRALMRAARWGDTVLLCIAFVAAYAWSHGLPAPPPVGWLEVLVSEASLLVAAGLGFHAAAVREHLYRSRRLEDLTGELIAIVRITAVSFVPFTLAAYLLEPALLTPDFIVLFGAGTVGLIAAQRVAVRITLRYARRQGHNFRRVLVIGTNERARRLCHSFADHPEYGLRVLGLADDRTVLEGAWPAGVRVVSTLAEVQAYLQTHVVDDVFLTLPMRTFFDEVQHIIATCEEMGVGSHVITDFYRTAIAGRDTGHIGLLPYVTYTTAPHPPSQLAIKRCVDVAASAAALIALGPLMALVAVAVRLTSQGPVLFGQRRIGYHKRPFTMWKFRTMQPDAEGQQPRLARLNEADGPVFKIRNDPRVTPVGRFLRRYSLDELPQLWNVLVGDMSLVGPRPLPAAQASACSRVQQRRLSMKPGLTCIWQVNGRDVQAFDKWVEMDLAYIDNWSLGLDARLMLRTIPAVLTGRGAY